MPAIGTITINNGAATPVAHNFDPVNINGDVAYWADRSGGVPSGYPKIDLSMRDPSTAARVYRVQGDVILPTVADGSNPAVAAGTVLYETRAQFTFFLPERSTLQERKDILAYVKNYLAHAVVTAVVQNLEHVY